MRKIKATSTGTPPMSGAQAFAWMLAAVTGKRPVLKVVEKSEPRHAGDAMRAANEPAKGRAESASID